MEFGMSQDAEVRQLREAFRQARDEAHLMRSSLVAEADALRAELQHVRQQAAQREAVRVEEREELVRAYEAMLGEQATAVAQQSALHSFQQQIPSSPAMRSH